MDTTKVQRNLSDSYSFDIYIRLNEHIKDNSMQKFCMEFLFEYDNSVKKIE